jgi:hypothetical protein
MQLQLEVEVIHQLLQVLKVYKVVLQFLIQSLQQVVAVVHLNLLL